jgi:hypothetical protein
MWVIAVLLPISFVLLVLARIVKKQSMFLVLLFCGVAVGFAAFLTCTDHSARAAIGGFLLVFLALSELIAISVWKRRVAPPSVLVKSVGREWVFYAIALCLWIVFVVYRFCTEGFDRSWGSVHMGLLTLWMIMMAILGLFSVTEICVDGIRRNGMLRKWKAFESFSWERNASDGVQLTLVSDSSVYPTTRCMVRPEDREAVQQLLKEHLPDLSET